MIGDETRDISGQTQLVIVCRYINKSSSEEVEHFWSYLSPVSVNAEGTIKRILEQLQIILQGIKKVNSTNL